LPPPYVLPGPGLVFRTLIADWPLLSLISSCDISFAL
jgi:hypothetical protein